MSSSTITWLASYPKSGNTWVRFLSLNLVHGPQRDTTKLQDLVPDIHGTGGQLAFPLPAHGLVKTHLRFGNSMPFLDRTAGCIYVVRNPVDVMLSNLNYHFWSYAVAQGDPRRASMQREYIAHYIDRGGDERWIAAGMGTWAGNIESWLGDARRFPMLVLRYEDIASATLAETRRIAEFLGLERTDEDLEQAIAAADFRRMKALEDREIASKTRGFFYSDEIAYTASQGNRFMNRARRGEGLQDIDADQHELVVQAFQPLMSQLGYRVDEERLRVVVVPGMPAADIRLECESSS